MTFTSNTLTVYMFAPQDVVQKRTTIAFSSAVTGLSGQLLASPRPGDIVTLIDEEDDWYHALVETVRTDAMDVIVDIGDVNPSWELPPFVGPGHHMDLDVRAETAGNRVGVEA